MGRSRIQRDKRRGRDLPLRTETGGWQRITWGDRDGRVAEIYHGDRDERVTENYHGVGRNVERNQGLRELQRSTEQEAGLP